MIKDLSRVAGGEKNIDQGDISSLESYLGKKIEFDESGHAVIGRDLIK